MGNETDGTYKVRTTGVAGRAFTSPASRET